MNIKTQKPTKTEEIETLQTVELDNVTGGCAACGMANCTMGASPTAGSPFNRQLFNRR